MIVLKISTTIQHQHFDRTEPKVKAPDFSTKEELLFTHRWKEDVKKACLKWRSEIKELPYLEL